MPIKSEVRKAIEAGTSGRPWVSIKEAALILSVDPMTIQRWIASDELPARRFGPKIIRIDFNDLERMGTPVAMAG